MAAFTGFDHIDVRVRSLALVEGFYDRLMPALGLVTKSVAYVDGSGVWTEPSSGRPYNAVEYHEALRPGEVERFIGFIEDPAMAPVRTRIAFHLPTKDLVREWQPLLLDLGAHNVEIDSDFDAYPAIFFEDPAGTRLELCSRKAKV